MPIAVSASTFPIREELHCWLLRAEEKSASTWSNFVLTLTWKQSLAASSPRAPRRLVLLQGDDGSDVAAVLREYQGADVSGARLHRDLQQLAVEHAGRTVAAEWLGSLGWTRFLWCRK